MRETKEEEVTLGEVHGDALQILVQYCYTGFIELREDTVETLLATACLLQLNAVVTACCNFLARQLHPSNCLGFAFFAEQQSCNTLLQLATAYTCQHFMQVEWEYSSKCLLIFPKENIIMLSSYFPNRSAKIRSFFN